MNSDAFMARALELAQAGEGYTSPNPMVGAVIVRDGRIIGEGFHARPGEAHAEVAAIENTREPIAGAEMYCNLEPCSHSTPHKRTPPCADRLIRENIRKLYVATVDPNPHVNGSGIAALRRAGIEVEVGCLSERALWLNETYFKYIQTGLPFVHLKMALSVDGRIATRCSDSKWITDGEARRQVHELRHRYDAVLVGLNTVRSDDPQLTVRLTSGKQPWRIVLDEHLEIPPEANLLRGEQRAKTLIFTTPAHDPARRARIEAGGTAVQVVAADPQGWVDLPAVLRELGSRGISSLLVEGGAGVFTGFIRQRLFDKLSIYIAPIIIGAGIEAVGDLGVRKISQAVRLQHTVYQVVNQQIRVQGYRNLEDTFRTLTGNVPCLQELSRISAASAQ